MSMKPCVSFSRGKIFISLRKSISFFFGRVLNMDISWLKYSLLTHMASNTFSSSNNYEASANCLGDLLKLWIINDLIHFFHDSHQLKQDAR